MNSFELDVALGLLGIYDQADKQKIADAIPVAQKLIEHIDQNKHLFDTLWADIKIILPSVKLVLNALKERRQ